MWWAIVAIAVAVIVLAGFFYWGQDRQKKTTAEQIAKERDEDAEIASRPFVDDPTDSMRFKD